MAQIRQVVSEALQSTVRRLLPSQQGFTEDLQASNVIIPVIDLTPTAEGSSLDVDLARALAQGSQTAFEVTNASSAIVNNAGFYRIIGGSSLKSDTSAARAVTFLVSDGLSSTVAWSQKIANSSSVQIVMDNFDFIVFLQSGYSLTGFASADCYLIGSYRQVADVNGNIVNPSGFSQQ